MPRYNGSCHCGNVKFNFSLDKPLEEQEVVQCNCSICTINGYLLVYPQTADVEFDHSDDAVKSYLFASKGFPHYFCVNCGTSVYAKCIIPENSGMMAVNVRTIPGIDVTTLKTKFIDGRSI